MPDTPSRSQLYPSFLLDGSIQEEGSTQEKDVRGETENQTTNTHSFKHGLSFNTDAAEISVHIIEARSSRDDNLSILQATGRNNGYFPPRSTSEYSSGPPQRASTVQARQGAEPTIYSSTAGTANIGHGVRPGVLSFPQATLQRGPSAVDMGQGAGPGVPLQGASGVESRQSIPPAVSQSTVDTQVPTTQLTEDSSD